MQDYIVVIEIIMLVIMMVICIRASYTDIKYGLIYNRDIIFFAIPVVVCDVIYYGFFVTDILLDFAINVIVVVSVSIALFYFHCLAGGDVKLMILVALAYPARWYLSYSENNYTLIFIMGIAIIWGYLYLLFKAIYDLIRKKSKITKSYLLNYLIIFVKCFLRAVIFIAPWTYLTYFVEGFGIYINPWISRIVCIVISLTVGRLKFFSNKIVVGVVLAIDIVAGILLQRIPFSLDLSNYVLVFILLICQMTIKTDIYKEVRIDELEKGMILSLASSMMFQNSRVRGLPSVSSENLKDRLTEEEIDSIKRWAKNRDVDSVTVVQKIPFAVFIFLGILSYIAILWGVR